MGVGGFGFLAGLTSVGVAVMVAGLTLNGHVGGGLTGIWASLLAFHVVQLSGVIYHHLRLGPLATTKNQKARRRKGAREEASGGGSGRSGGDDLTCITLPAAGGSAMQAAGTEVCVISEDEQRYDELKTEGAAVVKKRAEMKELYEKAVRASVASEGYFRYNQLKEEGEKVLARRAELKALYEDAVRDIGDMVRAQKRTSLQGLLLNRIKGSTISRLR